MALEYRPRVEERDHVLVAQHHRGGQLTARDGAERAFHARDKSRTRASVDRKKVRAATSYVAPYEIAGVRDDIYN